MAEICLHLELKRQADTMFRPFKSFTEGFRWYRCPKCGEIFKAQETAAHLENVIASHAPREAAAKPKCNCGADRTGPTAEAHSATCPVEIFDSAQPTAAQGQWINTDDRCPTPNSAILFWTVKDTWESGYFRADEDEPIRWEAERTGPQDERIDFFEGEVTHWMIPTNPNAASPPPHAPQKEKE